MIKLKSTKTIIVDGITFELRPERWDDGMRAREWAKSIGVKSGDPEEDMMVFCHMVISRIAAWQGPVLDNGKPAPCDETSRMELFGQHPELLVKLIGEIGRIQEEERKNS